jgi:hypothetical protein
VLHPQLLAEWDTERNPGLDPYRVGASSQRHVWWRCQTCGRGWRAVVKKRTAWRQGCPDCGKRKAAQFAASRNAWRQPREVSVGVLQPELLIEWHPDRNEGLDPFAVGTGSNLKIWWGCSKCGFEWQARPGHRCEGSGCPRCAGRHVPPELSLAALQPEWLADWHPDATRVSTPQPSPRGQGAIGSGGAVSTADTSGGPHRLAAVLARVDAALALVGRRRSFGGLDPSWGMNDARRRIRTCSKSPRSRAARLTDTGRCSRRSMGGFCCYAAAGSR